MLQRRRSMCMVVIIGLLTISSSSIRAFTPSPWSSTTYQQQKYRVIFAAAERRSGAMSRRRKPNNGKGFGDNNNNNNTPKEEEPSKKIVVESNKNEEEIYAFPALYDLAFGYRSYEDEVRFLLNRHQQHNTNNSDDDSGGLNILELAAGPGRHSMEALMQDEYPVQSCTAVDLSTDMAQYSQEVAAHELSLASNPDDMVNLIGKYNYNVNDMRNLPTDEFPDSTYDTAWILLGSMAHLITNQDVLDCFTSTHRTLKPGGTFIVELAHPRETFTMVECTKNEWTVPLEDDDGNEDFGELKIVWGDDDDPFDPIRQVRDFTVAMELSEKSTAKGGKYITKQKVKQVVPMRLFTAQEIDALARLAGFQIVEMFGALDEDVDVNSDEEAYRLVCVMKKE